MNQSYIIFHLKESLEELVRTIDNFERNSDFDEVEYEIAMSHLYNHINTAWNARNATDDETANLTDELFYKWRNFPNDINLDDPGLKKSP